MKHVNIDARVTAFRCFAAIGPAAACHSCGRLRALTYGDPSSTSAKVLETCRGCGESFAGRDDDGATALKIVIANCLV